MHREIKNCRICGNSDLVPVLDLGKQCLTGVFPKTKEEVVTSGPLELVKCREDKDSGHCGLLQLRQSYDLDEMYGDNYGYRSGLNRSMVEHLNDKARGMLKRVDLSAGDIVLDIGSNDGTLLASYPKNGAIFAGFDPTGLKFKEFYPAHVELVTDFFSARSFKNKFGKKKAKIVTSIAMFYDLEDPLKFMEEVRDILADDGLWLFEQSYMPTMLEMNSYDTVCHEHLEYYGLKQIKWMADKAGFKIADIEFNNINGGSFSITAAKATSKFRENSAAVEKILRLEGAKALGTLKPYEEFKERVFKNRDDLRQFVEKTKRDKKALFGYGASTKGNVLLQFCGFTDRDIAFIAEVNKDKFGCYTPGTLIPIISEEKAKAMKPDYFLVLPWHFKANIAVKERGYLRSGGKLFFPLPRPEVVEI